MALAAVKLQKLHFILKKQKNHLRAFLEVLLEKLQLFKTGPRILRR
jgi:hypothetical protein